MADRAHEIALRHDARDLVIDIAQRNVNSGFDLAKNLAGVKTFSEAVELQTGYCQKLLDTLSAQAEELRALSTKVAADTLEPIKAQITRPTAWL